MRTVESADELRIDQGFWYLGSPYTKCPLGTERAFELARDVSLRLQARGIRNYAPVVPGHYAECSAGLALEDPIWFKMNQPFIERAHGLIVLRLKGWRDSGGLWAEQVVFNAAGKTVMGLMPSLILGRDYGRERDIGDGVEAGEWGSPDPAWRQAQEPCGDSGDLERLLARSRAVREARYPRCA